MSVCLFGTYVLVLSPHIKILEILSEYNTLTSFGPRASTIQNALNGITLVPVRHLSLNGMELVFERFSHFLYKIDAFMATISNP